MIGVYLLMLLTWLGLFIWINGHVVIKNEVHGLDYSQLNDVTVVVPFRNESKNILGLLDGLNKTDGLENPLRVILVDDHSSDETTAFVVENQGVFNHLHIEVYASEGQGKKDALKLGLRKVDSSLVYLTDADCRVMPSTLSLLSASFSKSNVRAVFAPVLYRSFDLFTRLVALENLNTQVVTEAFINAKRPLLANGGNMMLHKDALPLYLASLEKPYSGGDDVFFIQETPPEKIVGIYQYGAAVYTSPPGNFDELLQQRLRWASKSADYRSILGRFIPRGLFILNFGFIVMLMDWVFLSPWISAVALLCVAKWLIEYGFQSYWFRKYNVSMSWWQSCLLTHTYPFYFVVIGLFSVFRPGFIWKERLLSQ